MTPNTDFSKQLVELTNLSKQVTLISHHCQDISERIPEIVECIASPNLVMIPIVVIENIKIITFFKYQLR